MSDRKRRKKEAKDRNKKTQEIEAKKYIQKVAEQAYLLWEADGKPKSKDNRYWKLATEKIKKKNIPILYRPYYWLEKHILEQIDTWIRRQASISIASQLAILATITAFIGGEKIRRNNEIFNAWQTITSAHEQPGSGGRIQALEFLNSRPLHFPWIGWTEEDWFWDENDKKCKRKRLLGLRWERERLVGLSIPNKAYLVGIQLCGAKLTEANLKGTYMSETNLQGADLRGANLEETNLRGANLQGAKLTEANLKGTYMSETNLQGADLRGANLEETNLRGANLQEADLWGADLQRAYLKEADLQGADLRGANLEETNLRGANLQGTYLIEVKLTYKQIKSTCHWKEAAYTNGYWNKTEKKWITLDEKFSQKEIEKIEKKIKEIQQKEPIDLSIEGYVNCHQWGKK